MRKRDRFAQWIVALGAAAALCFAIYGVRTAMQPLSLEGVGAVSLGTASALVFFTPPMLVLNLGLRAAATRQGGLASSFRRIQLWATFCWIAWTIGSARWITSTYTTEFLDEPAAFQRALAVSGGVGAALMAVQLMSIFVFVAVIVGDPRSSRRS